MLHYVSKIVRNSKIALNKLWMIIAGIIERVFSYVQANTSPVPKLTARVLYVGM